jgi:hypothetical protein
MLTPMKTHLLISYLGALAASSAASVIQNGSFEAPDIPSGSFNASVFNVPGWSTTDSQGRIEIWDNNFGVSAHAGRQHAEINAFENSALYQDVTIDLAGLVDFGFAHRGRSGVDTLRVDVTYAGIDALFGTGDDVVVVDGNVFQYSTNNTAWAFYAENDVFTSVAGGIYRFSYGAVSTATGSPASGNFIDSVSFGVDAIPEPSSALMAGFCGVVGIFRRRR